MKKFGELLISRPAGREAYLAASAYILPKDPIQEEIILDFDGVKVFAPSWGDEFITKLIEQYPNRVVFENTQNPSVQATLEILNLRKKA